MDPLARTALWVAAARAEETKRADRLFEDPFAAQLAGPEGYAALEHAATVGGGVAPVIEIRTHWFDERLAAAVAVAAAAGAGERAIRQVVLLAAGVDARAYRTAWPEGTRLFEVDREWVLAYKAQKLAGVAPRCDRRAVVVDLADDWPAALVAAGLDVRAPTAWLMEGLLVYLDDESVEKLFARVDATSSPGSVLFCDITGRSLLESPWMKLPIEDMERMGAPWRFGTDDPEGMLAAIGWEANVTEPAVVGARFGRWPFPVVARDVKGVPRSYLVEGRKTAARP
jgi:methyltransferase (TIGR00027 family)